MRTSTVESSLNLPTYIRIEDAETRPQSAPLNESKKPVERSRSPCSVSLRRVSHIGEPGKKKPSIPAVERRWMRSDWTVCAIVRRVSALMRLGDEKPSWTSCGKSDCRFRSSLPVLLYMLMHDW